MLHDVRPLHLTRHQCHERAKLVRSFAKGVTSELLRQDLLDIAAEYQRFADERRDSSDNRNDDAGDLVCDQKLTDRRVTLS